MKFGNKIKLLYLLISKLESSKYIFTFLQLTYSKFNFETCLCHYLIIVRNKWKIRQRSTVGVTVLNLISEWKLSSYLKFKIRYDSLVTILHLYDLNQEFRRFSLNSIYKILRKGTRSFCPVVKKDTTPFGYNFVTFSTFLNKFLPLKIIEFYKN